jgi:hypothetical protein
VPAMTVDRGSLWNDRGSLWNDRGMVLWQSWNGLVIHIERQRRKNRNNQTSSLTIPNS